MFSIDPDITDLKVKERKIFRILYSMNSHGVATPEMSVEEARCYILFFSEGSSFSAHIGLYLPGSDRKFFYNYSANPFPYEAIQDVEAESRNFAEDMGFLLDEIDVAGMSADDRNRWIEEQYIFGFRKPEPDAGEEGAAPAEAVEQDRPQAAQPPPPVQQEPPAAPAPVAAAVEAPAPAAPAAAPAAAAQPSPPPAPQPVKVPPQAAPVQQPPVRVPVQQPAPPPAPQRQQQKPAPQPRKPAPEMRRPVKPAPQTSEPLVTETAPSSLRPDDLIQEAVQSGVMKPPKPKLTSEMRTVTGVVSRDKEALARLMASF